jgi:hypothetical protein
VRKQARVNGVSGKARTGVRLKEHDELMEELQEESDQQAGSSQEMTPWRPYMKKSARREKHLGAFNCGVAQEVDSSTNVGGNGI